MNTKLIVLLLHLILYLPTFFISIYFFGLYDNERSETVYTINALLTASIILGMLYMMETILIFLIPYDKNNLVINIIFNLRSDLIKVSGSLTNINGSKYNCSNIVKFRNYLIVFVGMSYVDKICMIWVACEYNSKNYYPIIVFGFALIIYLLMFYNIVNMVNVSQMRISPSSNELTMVSYGSEPRLRTGTSEIIRTGTTRTNQNNMMSSSYNYNNNYLTSNYGLSGKTILRNLSVRSLPEYNGNIDRVVIFDGPLEQTNNSKSVSNLPTIRISEHETLENDLSNESLVIPRTPRNSTNVSIANSMYSSTNSLPEAIDEIDTYSDIL